MSLKSVVRSKRFLISTPICLLLILCAAIWTHYKSLYSTGVTPRPVLMGQMEVAPQDFAADFAEVSDIVKDHYKLAKPKHIDIDSLNNLYAQRIASGEVKTKEDYGMMLLNYFHYLYNSHSYPCYARYSAGEDVAYVQGNVFISHPNAYLVTHGLRDKDLILKIDGQKTSDWLLNQQQYQSGSSPWYQQLQAARHILSSYTKQRITYLVQRGQDTLDVTLPLLPPDNSVIKPQPLVTWSLPTDVIYKQDIAYIKINRLEGKDFMSQFQSAYDHVKHAADLILDLRGCSGDDYGLARKVCQYFLKKPAKSCTGYLWQARMSPNHQAYQGMQPWLIIDGGTSGAAEALLIDMREAGVAMPVGEPTAGDVGVGTRFFRTKRGTTFSLATWGPTFSHGGFQMEGLPYQPQVTSMLSISDFMSGRDGSVSIANQSIESRRTSQDPDAKR